MDLSGLSGLVGVFAVTAVRQRFEQEGLEGGFEGRNFDAVLGSFRTCDAWANGVEVEFDKGREVEGVFFGGEPEKVLGPVVVFDELNELWGAAGATEVGESFLIDGEVAHGGAILGGHIGNGGAIGEGELGGARPEEFDKFADDFVLAKDLSEGESKVGGGRGGGEFAREVDADNLGGEEGERLTKHSRLGFDSANPPTDNAEAVDHGGMGIGAHKGVGVGEEGPVELFFRKDAAGEVLEVDLVNDTDPWRDDAEGLEGLLAPFQEFVAFAIPFKFVLHIEHEGLWGAVDIDLDGVIDDKIDGNEGFDELGIFFEPSDGIAHRGKIHEEGYAGKVLEDDAGDGEGNFF